MFQRVGSRVQALAKFPHVRQAEKTLVHLYACHVGFCLGWKTLVPFFHSFPTSLFKEGDVLHSSAAPKVIMSVVREAQDGLQSAFTGTPVRQPR